MFSAGLLQCPRCVRRTEFYVETMARPGAYPEAFCCACDYRFAEGVVSDDLRAQAIEDLRREQIEHADVSVQVQRGRRPRR